MATFYGTNANLINAGGRPPQVNVDQIGGKLHCLRETFTYAAQAAASTLVLFGADKFPKGARFAFGLATTTDSTGSATLAFGIAGATGKYKTAAAITTTNVPQIFGVGAAINTELTAAETIIITTADASLPASGTLYVDWFYTIQD